MRQQIVLVVNCTEHTAIAELAIRLSEVLNAWHDFEADDFEAEQPVGDGYVLSWNWFSPVSIMHLEVPEDYRY